MSLWRKLGLAYLIILLASNALRFLPSDDLALDPGKKSVTVSVADAAAGTPVRIAYYDRQVAQANAPVVVLLHGSPSPGALTMLIAPLADHFRVIAPDFPGFGDSTLRVPDYSIAAHAAYIDALLGELDVPRAHLVSYSLGGGVALELYARAPDRVASLTQISAIGVQELELFGSYALNHAVHGLQLGLLTLVEWGLPHFGYLDDAFLNTTYARNFYDTDQRPLRGLMRTLEVPLLIVHGRGDTLVPFEAAREHHRIVAHSELVPRDGGHGMIFSQAPELARIAAQFIDRVETGQAPLPQTATAARVAAAALPFDWGDARRFSGLGLVLILLLLAVSTYASEDLTCIAAGLLVARDVLPFWPAMTACLLGIYTGDLLLFFAGRHLGKPAMTRAPLKWLIRPGGIRAAGAWFERNGPWAIIGSRFMPGTRFTLYVAAGALGTSAWRFAGWFLLAAILWTPLLVGAAMLTGTAALEFFSSFEEHALPAFVVLALGLFLLLKLLLPLTSYRGRRLLASRLRRIRRRAGRDPHL